MENKGQKTEEWADFWKGSSPESEIQMWDFFGLRPWILKYTPRYGKVCEAGCGLGRYVFYLNKLGIDIDGLDFEQRTIEGLHAWKKKNGFEKVSFIHGDVTKLPYENDFLSSYISLGVIEHFIDGPNVPLKEAYRVLQPGGIAIITTPSVSWYLFYRDHLKRGIKNLIKRIIGEKIIKPAFFQYWYRPKKLRKFIEDSGFYVTRSEGADMLYSFIEANNFKVAHWTGKSLPIRISNKFEGSILSALGAQSVSISIKLAEKMCCFFCGKLKAAPISLKFYDVPVCDVCSKNELALYYRKGVKVKYHAPYQVFPLIKPQTEEVCEICGEKYVSDKIFEDFGFTKYICPEHLQEAICNIRLSNTAIQPVFRLRKKLKR
ncbi:MAG: methyltransferase domain-containing protein [Bacteroidales bacterium]|nr:methyltransferase domain-containing protein [Bacteroidales bacterium]